MQDEVEGDNKANDVVKKVQGRKARSSSESSGPKRKRLDSSSSEQSKKSSKVSISQHPEEDKPEENEKMIDQK